MAMVAPEPQVPPMVSVDKLSHEIFSILEAQFLFGYPPNNKPKQAAPPALAGDVGRVRILSVDAAGPTDGLLASASLARLESALRRSSSLPDARLPDFFDLAAGSGHGGLLVSLLFARGPDARPLFSAADAFSFLADLRRPRKSRFSLPCRRGGLAGRVGRAFGDLTLRDALKPLLVPCYDLASRSAFVFSRADAVEADAFDFRLRDVCAATCGAAVEVASVDGNTRILGLDGGVAMSNPAAAAVTHALNNRQEFPFVRGVEDLLVVSLGNGEPTAAAYNAAGGRSPSSRDLVRIAGDGVADVVDQAVAMAFGRERSSNYVRIQGNGCGTRKAAKITRETATKEVVAAVEGMLKEKNVESVMFRGKKVAQKSNEEMLDLFALELIKEEERRKLCIFPTVVLKQVTPRTSSATTSSC